MKQFVDERVVDAMKAACASAAEKNRIGGYLCMVEGCEAGVEMVSASGKTHMCYPHFCAGAWQDSTPYKKDYKVPDWVKQNEE
jgi:hypothetical protein